MPQPARRPRLDAGCHPPLRNKLLRPPAEVRQLVLCEIPILVTISPSGTKFDYSFDDSDDFSTCVFMSTPHSNLTKPQQQFVVAHFPPAHLPKLNQQVFFNLETKELNV